ncbi:MAG TPA: polysaccharide deacetylase family protein [Chloroflexota bacterium]
MHPLSPLMSTNLVVPFHVIPSKEWFRTTLRMLGRFYSFISAQELEQYLHGKTRFNSRCHLTFDDGDRTFLEHAFPILQKLGIPATLFVAPAVIERGTNYWFQEFTRARDHLGETAIKAAFCECFGCEYAQIEPFSAMSLALCLSHSDIRRLLDRLSLPPSPAVNVTVDELRQIANSPGICIGAHTLEHPVLANETDDRAGLEIRQSVRQLAELLGPPVRSFAYPNGNLGLDFGGRERRLLRECGIVWAASMDPGFVSRATDPLAVPRAGCPSLQGESPLRAALRLLLLPYSDRAKRVAPRRRRLTEAEERRALYASGILSRNQSAVVAS